MKNINLAILMGIFLTSCGGGGKDSGGTDSGDSLSYLTFSYASSNSEGTDCYEHSAATLTGSSCTSVGGTYTGTSVPAVYKCVNSTTSASVCNAQSGVIKDNCKINGDEWTKIGSSVTANSTKACTDAGGSNYLSCDSIPDSTKCGNLPDGVWTLVSSATTTWSCTGYNLNTKERCDIAGGQYKGRKRIAFTGNSNANEIKSGSFAFSVMDSSYATPLDYLDSGDTVSKISMILYLREGGSSYWYTSVTPTFQSTIIESSSSDSGNYVKTTFSKKYTSSTDDNISGNIYIYE